jgi:hypothetical protein
VLGVDIRSTVGLGAKLEWCLEIMAYCHEHRLLPQFRFSYPEADPAEDYFGRLFTIRGAPDRQVSYVTIGSILDLDLGKDYDQVLTVELAHDLITRYLAVREDVLAEVEGFCRQRFEGRSVVGVHYRGTDKVEESPRVSYASVRRNIERFLELYPATEAVFVATDDANFLHDLQHRPPGRPVFCRKDAFRSTDGSSVHHSPVADKHAINRDALANCLILSRCDALLKTASILSGWSKLFNPRLPVVMLSAPHPDQLWFPERALVGENLFEPSR